MIEQEIQDRIDFYKKMDPYDFEFFVSEIFEKNGHDSPVVTKRSGDGGFDFSSVLNKGGISIPCKTEVKRWQGNVGINPVKILNDNIEPGSHGIFVTTSGFPKSVVDYAKRKGITLIEGRQLVEMERKVMDEPTKIGFYIEPDVDEKAVKEFEKIYNEIIKENSVNDEIKRHDLNVFMARLLFCMFAEDTGIFPIKSFLDYVLSVGNTDAEWNSGFLNVLFNKVLDKKTHERPAALAKSLYQFPYVNGSLFKNVISEFKLSIEARKQILACCGRNWAKINPDIFGAIFQDVVTGKQRKEEGQHYTSVDNILKLINPRFMDSLREDFENSRYNTEKLKNLLNRIANIHVFDPACGSGNFLIIAYKELRRLEIQVLDRLRKRGDKSPLVSNVDINQFHGIELDDFAHELAILSLWLTEHQMNLEFEDVLGPPKDNIPLTPQENIIQGNSLQEDWNDVCPKKEGREIYIVGNPPFLGSSKLSEDQRKDMISVFNNIDRVGKLDYVCGWFKKASDYIKDSKVKFALVSTNSISRGEQAPVLWPEIFSNGQSIDFAYEAFDWKNNAKDVAGVAVIIAGISNEGDIEKRLLFNENGKPQEVDNISPYLRDKSNLVISPLTKHITGAFPDMIEGNRANDNGALILSEDEYKNEVRKAPELKKFLREFIGAKEFVNSTKRYCLWITEDNKDDALKIPFIRERVEKCREHRLGSANKTTRQKADIAWRFDRVRQQEKSSFLIPTTTTDKREYFPVGYYENDTVISNLAQMVIDAGLHVFGILSSKLHLLWINETCNQMGKAGRRYNSNYVFNTFYVPKLTDEKIRKIENKVEKVLEIREKYLKSHPNNTIARLYAAGNMGKFYPELLEAHGELDDVVEECYKEGGFQNDKERLNFLIDKYKEATAK